ncbi:hypothetical protein [Oligoflexus tunisiensis]|nr:hypothetical protein [Oligoflexus tunisiensis]
MTSFLYLNCAGLELPEAAHELKSASGYQTISSSFYCISIIC